MECFGVLHQSGNLTNSLRLLKEDYLTFPGKGFSKNKKTFLIIEPERETYAPPVGEGLGADEGSTLQNIEERYIENETNGADFTYQTPGNHHERRMDRSIETNTGRIFPLPGKENLNKPITQKNMGEEMLWEIMTKRKSKDQFVFRMAPNREGTEREGNPLREEVATGLMAMCFDEKLGWVAETLGPKSSH